VESRLSPPIRWPRRRVLRAFAVVTGGAMATWLAACREGRDGKAGNHEVRLDVSLFSYLNRPIFDVLVNGRDIGVAGPLGGGALMTGVAVLLGPQVVTWRLGGPEGMAGNGDTVRATNQPVLTRTDPKLIYLGVHIYPGNTVELVPEAFWPERTQRGEAIAREQASHHGR
jgi:hypothetical protein